MFVLLIFARISMCAVVYRHALAVLASPTQKFASLIVGAELALAAFRFLLASRKIGADPSEVVHSWHGCSFGA
jgi:hypothetical protein